MKIFNVIFIICIAFVLITRTRRLASLRKAQIQELQENLEGAVNQNEKYSAEISGLSRLLMSANMPVKSSREARRRRITIKNEMDSVTAHSPTSRIMLQALHQANASLDERIQSKKEADEAVFEATRLAEEAQNAQDELVKEAETFRKKGGGPLRPP